ncbi:transposase [Mesorhizobium sp. C280B]|uniref:transposase n=1 Tax=Mesorhizobium sp. C280B TaxID=2956828 RepID=UPI0018DC5E6D
MPRACQQTHGRPSLGARQQRRARIAVCRCSSSSRLERLQSHHPRAEEWLLVEWPEGDKEPLKYWLSTLPETMSLRDLVATTKLRWRIERDYRELKQELGLGHYEGRGWRGFHHHASLCIAAYGFLLSERETIPPQHLPRPKSGEEPPVPRGPRSDKTARSARATHLKLDRDPAPKAHRRSRSQNDTMSMLCKTHPHHRLL